MKMKKKCVETLLVCVVCVCVYSFCIASCIGPPFGVMVL
jgi:hypothetical protein